MTETPSTGAEPSDPAAELNDDAALRLRAGALAGAGDGAGGHAARLLDVHNAVTALHTTRDGTRDLRCRTCRTPEGDPAPWPCETLTVLREAMGLALPGAEVERLRDWGRIRNGAAPATDWGRRTVEHCRAGHR